MSKPVTAIIIGAGGRGWGYANYATKRPEEMKVVGVAEPRDFHRNRIVETHGVESGMVFGSWEEAAEKPRLADAAIICTQDAMHEEPVKAFAKLGYHILLEKPMAPTAESCQRIYDAVKDYDSVFAVCHVLRYQAYTRVLKKMLTDGLIGDVINIEHYEPVGFWHQAHSFVRGNWRNERESSFMLLAKSCHDIDWLSHIVDKPCTRVSSFGSLRHFRRSEQPEGAADRCLDCKFADTCAYSAKRFYFDRLDSGAHHWPLDVVDPLMTAETLEKALREGPYGRCVYACDNDVVDNQIVNLEYEGGTIATFTMAAFNPGSARKTRIGGSKGYIETLDGSVIRHYDYFSKEWREIDTEAADASILGGHGGGDGGLMEAFLRDISRNERSAVISGAEDTIESHLTVFAAEHSRRIGQVVDMADFRNSIDT